MQLIDVAGRAAMARGVENADFEMAAKFPSIALVKYKDGGGFGTRRGRRRGRRGWRTRGNGRERVQGRGRRPVADAGEGCIAITQIAALFSPAPGLTARGRAS